MITEELVVEAVWSSPETSALFLGLCEIYVQIRNKSNHPIQIQKIECHFQCEEDVEPCTPDYTPHLTLKPGEISSPIPITFNADLVLKMYTNSYVIIIQYRNDDIKILKHDPRKFIIFKPRGPHEKLFFISHKDHEDTEISRWLAQFLQKLGFIGYMSEDDRRPGINLWKEKISNAIKTSVAVIILWTSRAAKNPDNIYREIEIANSFGKRLILSPEQGVTVPDNFSKDIEYYQFEKPISKSELKKLACSIEETPLLH